MGNDLPTLVGATPAASATVETEGRRYALHPVSCCEILELVPRFPSLRRMLFGHQPGRDIPLGLTEEELGEQAPEAAAAFVARACDAKVPMRDLIPVLTAAMTLTMPAPTDLFFKTTDIAAAPPEPKISTNFVDDPVVGLVKMCTELQLHTREDVWSMSPHRVYFQIAVLRESQVGDMVRGASAAQFPKMDEQGQKDWIAKYVAA